MKIIKIPHEYLTQIIEHRKACYPNEKCWWNLECDNDLSTYHFGYVDDDFTLESKKPLILHHLVTITRYDILSTLTGTCYQIKFLSGNMDYSDVFFKKLLMVLPEIYGIYYLCVYVPQTGIIGFTSEGFEVRAKIHDNYLLTFKHK